MTHRRVEVFYFPKRPRPRRASTEEAPADPSYSRTVEFRPDFAADPQDRPTEPWVALRDGVREEEAPARAKRTKSKDRTPKVKTPPPQKGVDQRDAKPRPRREKKRRITLDIDTDPALRYHVRKLDELLQSRSPVEALRGMTRHELAEMSLFGHQLFEAGKLEEARVVFEGLVGLDLADAFPHTMLGTVYLAQGRPDRAAALFDAALSLDPRDLAARVYRAELRLSAGEVRPAVTELSDVVRQGPAEDPFVQRAGKLLEIAHKGRRRR